MPKSLQDGIECFQHSEQEISASKKQMADLIERNRRVIEEFERGSQTPHRKSSAQSSSSSGYASHPSSRKSSNTSNRSFDEEDEDDATEASNNNEAKIGDGTWDREEDPDEIRPAQEIPEATTQPRDRRTSIVEESIG